MKIHIIPKNKMNKVFSILHESETFLNRFPKNIKKYKYLKSKKEIHFSVSKTVVKAFLEAMCIQKVIGKSN
jgi:hypothetical protein